MITKNDFRYFDKAHHAAMISNFSKTHIGCIAVYKDNIIGVGCNLEKTHPMQKYYNKYRMHPQKFYYSPIIHAEINCLNSIRNLDINFSKVRLYIYIESEKIRTMECHVHVLIVWLQLRI